MLSDDKLGFLKKITEMTLFSTIFFWHLEAENQYVAYTQNSFESAIETGIQICGIFQNTQIHVSLHFDAILLNLG